MSDRPRVAVIGTGGTIASQGDHSLELIEYIDRNRVLDVEGLLAQVPELDRVADIEAVPFRALQSTAVGPAEWLELRQVLEMRAARAPEVDGLVVTHGTASLEETAYFLNLTTRVEQPVVVVGAQRPITGLASDGPINLLNAVMVAGDPHARGEGVLVVLNNEIQAAREVTKTSTLRLQTFRTADFGVLGQVDPDGVHFYRSSRRRAAPDTEFDLAGVDELPRVDIVYTYAGADGALIEAAVAAGARGLVVAAYAPGLTTPAQFAALNAASEDGVIVVQASRAGSGRVVPLNTAHPVQALVADNLTPQKARILLMVALTATSDRQDIQRMFSEY